MNLFLKQSIIQKDFIDFIMVIYSAETMLVNRIFFLNFNNVYVLNI